MKSLSKIIKNCCVTYDSAPRIIGSKVKIIKPQKKVDVGNILSSNALESADISLKKALRKAVSTAEQSRVQAQIAYAAAHKKGREHGYTEGLEKGRIDGIVKSEEKVNGVIDEFIAKVSNLDSDYKSKIETVKDECIDFAFSLAENILGSRINREDPEFNDLKNTYLSAQPQKVLLEADGRILELDTLNSQRLIESAKEFSDIKISLKQEKLATEEKSNASAEEAEETFTEKINEIENETFEEAAVSTIPEKNVENEADSDEQEKISDIKDEKTIIFPNLDSGVSSIDDDYEVPDDKLVYVRPNIKPAALNSAENMSFEDLKDLKKETLKAILRKVSAEDMAAALSGVSDEISKIMLCACPRKTKEKTIDAIKYLGPVPENEVDTARQKIISIACEYLKREE